VGDDRADAGFLPIDVKLFDLFLAVRFGSPLARRFGEDLNRVTSDFLPLHECIADAAGNGHMCAQKRAAWL
jgi:hypothetical protein